MNVLVLHKAVDQFTSNNFDMTKWFAWYPATVTHPTRCTACLAGHTTALIKGKSLYDCYETIIPPGPALIVIQHCRLPNIRLFNTGAWPDLLSDKYKEVSKLKNMSVIKKLFHSVIDNYETNQGW